MDFMNNGYGGTPNYNGQMYNNGMSDMQMQQQGMNPQQQMYNNQQQGMNPQQQMYNNQQGYNQMMQQQMAQQAQLQQQQQMAQQAQLQQQMMMQQQMMQQQMMQQMSQSSQIGMRRTRVVTIPRVRLGMQYYMMYQGKKKVGKEEMLYELENIISQYIGKQVMRVNIEETPDIIRHICDNSLKFLVRQEDAFSCNSNMVVPYYVCPYCGKMYINKSNWE